MKRISQQLILCGMLGILFQFGIVSSALAQQQTTSPLDTALETRLSRVERKIKELTPGQSHLVIVGLTTFGFVSSKNVTTGVPATKGGGFGGADTYEFSPMFLWRQGNKVLLEFEPSFSHDGVGVNWAAISYFAMPNLIVRGGYFVLPFGIYNKKLAAGWINKVATDPIGLPTSADYGFEISGGKPLLGTMKWNYDFSVTNGMSLVPDGTLQSNGLNTNTRNKTYTGRLGLLPFSNSSLELGISGLHGGVGNGNPNFNNAILDMFALDLNYVKNFDPFLVSVKGQFNMVNVNSQTYHFLAPADTTQTYTFRNHTTSAYGQFSIRPVQSESEFIKRLELAFRYGNYTTPAMSVWGAKSTQTDFGLNYWINWRTVLHLTYEILNSTSTANTLAGGSAANNKNYALHVQFSIQL